MEHNAKSIRPFIGCREFELTRGFYRDLGFHESVIDAKMSYFNSDGMGFYLQDYYAREWIDNTMVFLEVDDVIRHREELLQLKLPERYPGVRVTDIREWDWGREYFLHDPSGVLWHFGRFGK